MKKIVFSALLLFGIVNIAAAQRTRLHPSKTNLSIPKDTTVVGQVHDLSQTYSYNAYLVKPAKLDNRQNILWKDGQKATTTGHEAAASNDESFISLTKK